MSKFCKEHSGEKIIAFCRKANCDAKNRICCNLCLQEGPHKKHITMNLGEIQETYDSAKSAWKKIESNIDKEF